MPCRLVDLHQHSHPSKYDWFSFSVRLRCSMDMETGNHPSKVNMLASNIDFEKKALWGEMNMMNRCFFTLLAVILGIFYNANPASAIQTKSLSPDNNNNLYQVTCDNGKQHTIIANHAEKDFQYYYPQKGYYIKYYDIEFKDLKDFAEWVCRNK